MFKCFEQTCASKVLNEYLKYIARLTKGSSADLMKRIMEINLHSKASRKFSRCSRVRSYRKTHKSYASNQIESLDSFITTMLKNIDKRIYAVNDLSVIFSDYIKLAVDTRKENKRMRLKKNLS